MRSIQGNKWTNMPRGQTRALHTHSRDRKREVLIESTVNICTHAITRLSISRVWSLEMRNSVCVWHYLCVVCVCAINHVEITSSDCWLHTRVCESLQSLLTHPPCRTHHHHQRQIDQLRERRWMAPLMQTDFLYNCVGHEFTKRALKERKVTVIWLV